MKVELLASTPKAEKLICKAAHVCYSDKAISEIETNDADIMIGRLIASGHMSVLEHASFTFGIEGISRVCLAQLTRHRLASYSVRSQRYTESADAVLPRGVDEKEVNNEFKKYEGLKLRGWKKEDARYVLPQAVTTSLILTMNARELLHFFSLRCCNKAQWEIRELANEMLRLVKEIAPNIFKKGGAACVQRGYCKEAVTCGRMPDVVHKDFLMSLYESWKKAREK